MTFTWTTDHPATADRTAPAAHRVAATLWRRRTIAIAIPLALAAVITGSASGASLIRVHPGDTLSGIALRYHTTVARLIALNHLPGNGDLIYAGQTLRLTGAPSTRLVTVRHTVVAGDTLDGIAARYHVTPASIARRNHLPSSLVVVLGSSLAIPHHTRTQSTSPSPSTGVVSGVRQERDLLDSRAEPNREQIDTIIRATAAQWGVDPRLALAISWQESGWNMREVSGVGAIGAMQVMPATGAFISDDVVHRSLDLSDAHDNITAGVALLSLLTHDASSTSEAVAGYYQGLGSVRSSGMFASTKQYVADVMSLRQSYLE